MCIMRNHVDILKTLRTFGFYPKNALDIGSYRGQWSKTMAQLFPECKFALVDALNFEIELQDNLTFYHALLDSTERETQWFEKRNSGDSMFREKTSIFSDCEIKLRKTMTLEKLFPSKVFDLIKIDCQGAEIPIIEGGLELVERSSVIILEVPVAGQYNEGVPGFASHIEFMNKLGFELIDICQEHRIGLKYLIQTDLVFAKRKTELFTAIEPNLTQSHPSYNLIISGGKIDHVVGHIRKQRLMNDSFRVLCIGKKSSIITWPLDIVTDFIAVDNNVSSNVVNINFNTWNGPNELLKLVEDKGKYDFCICMDVLQISNDPIRVSNFIERIAKSGFMSVPSKMRELSQCEGPYLGSINHRWVYAFNDGVLTGYPKIGILEKAKEFIAMGDSRDGVSQQSFFWKEEISMRTIGNTYLEPIVPNLVAAYKDGLIMDDMRLIATTPFKKVPVLNLNDLQAQPTNDVVRLRLNMTQIGAVVSDMESKGYVIVDISGYKRHHGFIVSLHVIFAKKSHQYLSDVQQAIENLGKSTSPKPASSDPK